MDGVLVAIRSSKGTAEVIGHYDDNDGLGNAKMVVTRGIVGNQEPGDSGGPFHDGGLFMA